MAIVGHKADVCLLALGPDLWRLRRFQTEVAAAGLDVVDSYVSLTEVSEYAERMPEERKQARLYPQLPPEGKPAFCFYPMSKRRGDEHNWYELPYEDREQLMLGHGGSGRNFAGRVLQLVTGSTGIDDYEWGVTLFGVAPRRPQGMRLHDALRRGLVALRRVRPVPHRGGRHRSTRCWPPSASAPDRRLLGDSSRHRCPWVTDM